jgi:PAS domain S-box-containing protein
LKVLIADDREDDALLMVEALREGRFDPTWTWVNGRAGIERALASDSWDVILTDYAMPGFNGLDVLRLVRLSGLDVPVVVVSGTIGEEKAVDILNAGASDCVLKDNLTRMPPTVERVLAVTEARRNQKRAEEALRHSQELYRGMVEGSPDGIVLVDGEARILQANHRMAELLGYRSSAELVGKMGITLLAERQTFELAPLMEQTFREGRGPAVEVAVQRADGNVIDVEVCAVVIGNGPGGLRAVVTVHDITERKAAEQMLRASNRALRLLSEVNRAVTTASEEADVLKRVCEIITQVGQLPLAWVGFARDDAAGSVEPVASAGRAVGYLERISVSWADVAEGNGPIGRALRSGRTVAMSTQDPSFLIWREPAAAFGLRSSIAIPVPIGQNPLRTVLSIYACEPRSFFPEEIEVLEDLARSLGAGLDVLRERKARHDAEIRSQRAQRLEAIGRLAGGIAHDFNNMLAVITGCAEFLLEDIAPGDSRREDVLEIRKAAQRSVRLTQQLLAFSRRQILKPEVLNLDEVVRDVESMLRRVIGEDVTLVTVPARDLRPVRVDRSQMEQVLMNLAVNARDAMPRGGALTIETTNMALDNRVANPKCSTPPGWYVLLTVSDTGTGMTEEVRERLFEPFFTTKDVDKGTGLGLATIHGIVEQSGGRIWVESEVGLGTTFKICLPAFEGALEAPDKGPSSWRPLRTKVKLTVLLVEDEAPVRAVARRIVEGAGYDVLEAPNGIEALEVSERYEGPIHLLLTDVVMPRMGGRELAAELRRVRAETRVLFMSGYTDDAAFHGGALEADTAFIAKPFTRAALTAKLLEVLEVEGAVE